MGGMAAAGLDQAALAPRPRDRRSASSPSAPSSSSSRWCSDDSVLVPSHPLRSVPGHAAALGQAQLRRRVRHQLRADPAGRAAWTRPPPSASCSTGPRSRARPATSSRTCGCWPTPSTLVDHGNGERPGGVHGADPRRVALGRAIPAPAWSQAIEATGELADAYPSAPSSSSTCSTPTASPSTRPATSTTRPALGLAVVKAAADELVATGVPVVSAHHEGGAGPVRARPRTARPAGAWPTPWWRPRRRCAAWPPTPG